ncbi:MAG: hypothetical protein ABL859_02020 [Methylotenera sp.]
MLDVDAALPIQQVTKRQVFYLSGFDPRGAAYYHRLYQEESSAQAQLHHADIQVGDRARLCKHHNFWKIQANWPNQVPNQADTSQQVKTDYHFLNWDDIVRQHWQTNLFKLLLASVVGYWGYIRCGAFSQIQQHYRGPFFSAIYPFFYLILLVLFSLGLASVTASVLLAVVNPVFANVFSIFLLGICLFYGAQIGNKWGVFWLLRTYLFVFNLGLNDSSLLQERLDEFVEIIKYAQQDEAADEVLLVGHSVGTILAVHLAALYLQRYPTLAAKVKLVTLGQCIPLIHGVPQAQLFNSHLNLLQMQSTLKWFDFLARADSLAFLNVQNLANLISVQPNTLLVRFFNGFANKRYLQIKRNKLRLHFQYLMATEKLCEYDYFRMTVGFLPLLPHLAHSESRDI